jgi:hypothetical protein
MIKDNDVVVLHNAAGVDQCPDGKLALYTNVNFNNGAAVGETSDILIMSPDVQLDTEALESYGFIVGEHDGVSSVVNKMSKPATLVSGTNLDGYTLPVSAGQNISSLVNYMLPSGATWNDATNSVVSASVTITNLAMVLESGISMQQDETYLALLQITNNSETSVTGATVDVSSGNVGVFTVTTPVTGINIPANQTTNVRISMSGVGPGSATLTCTLNTPLGIINNGNNVSSTSVTVTAVRQLQILVGTVTHWQDVWPSTQFIYSYPLTMSAAETQVNDWELSFLLPEGAALNEAWLQSESSWVTVNTEKSVNGNIYLDSQPDHVIDPTVNINLTLQIDYPEVSTEHETLNNLRLMQLD